MVYIHTYIHTLVCRYVLTHTYPHLPPPPRLHIKQPHITQGITITTLSSSDKELGVISTIAKTHSSMDRSPLWTGLSLSVHFAEVLHKEYTMATHMSHSGMDMYTQASWELVWQHRRCRGCCNPWSAMLRFFIHEVKGTYIILCQFLSWDMYT